MKSGTRYAGWSPGIKEKVYPGAVLLEELGKRQSLDAEELLSKQVVPRKEGNPGDSGPWGLNGLKVEQDRPTIFLSLSPGCAAHDIKLDIKTSKAAQRAVTTSNPGLWGAGPEHLLLFEGAGGLGNKTKLIPQLHAQGWNY